MSTNQDEHGRRTENFVLNCSIRFLEFRSKRMISKSLTETLESGDRIDVVHMDFEKAFDKVPHNRLLSKLKAYKLHNTIIEWIKNFLTDR